MDIFAYNLSLDLVSLGRSANYPLRIPFRCYVHRFLLDNKNKEKDQEP